MCNYFFILASSSYKLTIQIVTDGFELSGTFFFFFCLTTAIIAVGRRPPQRKKKIVHGYTILLVRKYTYNGLEYSIMYRMNNRKS